MITPNPALRRANLDLHKIKQPLPLFTQIWGFILFMTSWMMHKMLLDQKKSSELGNAGNGNRFYFRNLILRSVPVFLCTSKRSFFGKGQKRCFSFFTKFLGSIALPCGGCRKRNFGKPRINSGIGSSKITADTTSVLTRLRQGG